jgi:hypothetical protein
MRATLDAAYGYPNEDTLTQTAIPPASGLPFDSLRRVYLAVDEAYCDYELPRRLLAEGIAAGVVEELDVDAFREASTL